MNIFEITDKTGRKIRLTGEQWGHILRHRGMEQHLNLIKETLKNPINIIAHEEGNLFDYYLYLKHMKLNYLKVVVKYLNGEGFILSAYFVRRIN